MGNYVFAGLAFLLLLLLCFLVPIKFSKVGKWFIPAISFLVSILGIYINQIHTWWHSLLAMALLLLLTAILLQRLPLFKSSTETNHQNHDLNHQLFETNKEENPY
ncbi:hypothetical protein [Sutcliffiella rhizosphaerae]|uniref:hypothetical protein n=1 Tax=Sutcliffiella rhizosphaerae TaxID=2880967 RepID=UPI001E2BE1A8|nr:hypothetical protein [Sutcliffiella rhizosphaerae]